MLGTLAVPAAHAQAPAATTVDLVATHSSLSAGQPGGQALNLRLTSLRGGDNVWRAELLRERRFGVSGGVIGAGFSQGLGDTWFMGANLTLGEGGPNWPRQRLDLSLSSKLGARREFITQASAYRALYDNQRSDTGIGLALVSYATAPLVLQAGVVFNVSDPGAVHSRMFSASGSWGQEGQQFVSLRLAAGSESYQTLGVGQQLVDFQSRSLALAWRQWLGPRWGWSAQAEHYHNPSYERLSVGLGLFSQW
jgi:YaiO family outer membrane protein